MDVLQSLEMAYYNLEDENPRSQFDTYLLTEITEMEMMIKTRPRYPSNKLTFTIADQAKGKAIRFFNINLSFNVKIDFAVSLEDSKRNFVNSF